MLAQCRVDTDAIAANVAVLAARARSAEVLAVVKADGYGHGALPVARAALAGGASWLGVAQVGEALALRAGGLRAPLMAWLLAPDERLGPAVEAGVDLGISSARLLSAALAAASTAGRPARVHLKADTGLSRGGATAADWPALVEAAAAGQRAGRLDVVGVFSHLACADVPGDPSIAAQTAAFDEALAVAAAAGLEPRYRHLANSAATLSAPATHYDLVRPGIAVYGVSPGPALGTPAELGLRPAMTLAAEVALTKRVPAGTGVSYGLTYHTDRETTLALLPLGYADGLPRTAVDGPVQLNGQRFAAVGRICMDQVVLDVGDAPVRAGDRAVLFGPGADGEPLAEDWARAAGTIGYEIVSRIGPRVPRVHTGVAG